MQRRSLGGTEIASQNEISYVLGMVKDIFRYARKRERVSNLNIQNIFSVF